MATRAPLAAAIFFCAAAPWTAAAQDTLTVGGVTARRGEKQSGWIEVPAGSDPGTRLPVSVVHGARAGKVLALIAGTHGYEYTSVVALPRVLAALDPARMTGSVILVHMANPPSFYGRRIYYGPDGKNLNRVYPGQADGTVSERIAHAITTQVIDQATHLVDMHCGDGNESLRPYSYWQVSGNEALDEAGRQMALAFGLDHIVIDGERPRDAARSVYTSNTAVLRGKPAITAESGPTQDVLDAFWETALPAIGAAGSRQADAALAERLAGLALAARSGGARGRVRAHGAGGWHCRGRAHPRSAAPPRRRGGRG